MRLGLAGLAASGLLVLLFPVLFFQAWRLRDRIPRLPEAPGPRKGHLPGHGRPLRLLVLGESPAAGVGVDSFELSVGPRLAARLAEHSGRPVDWQVLAANGRTAADLAIREVSGLESAPVDLVIIALGVNDTLRFHATRRWLAGIKVLIRMLQRRCGSEVSVLVTPVPDLARFPALPGPLRHVLGLKARALDAALARRLAGSRQVHRPEVALDGAAPDFFASDGFHPGPAGHQAWAERLAEAAMKQFPALAKPRQDRD